MTVANEHIEEVGLRFKADGSVDFVNSLKGIRTELSTIYGEYQRELNMMDKNATTTEKLTAKKKMLERSIEEQKDKVAVLTKQLETLEGAENKDADAIANANKQLVYAQSELAGYEKSLKKTTDEMKNHSQWTDQVSDKLKKVGKGFEDAGKKMAVVSGAAAGLVVGAAKSAIDFESAFTGVIKTTDTAGMSADEAATYFDNLAKGMIDLSMETTTSASDIAKVGEAAGQLGIEKENVLDFTKVMIQLGDTTNLSAETAATALAKLTNITGMDPAFYSNLGSSIVALGNNFATSEADIVAMATKLASTGTLAGLTEPQMLAYATALSSVGIEAEAGGTAASKLIKQMQIASETGSIASETLASTGYTLRDLQMLADTDSESFKGLAHSMGLTAPELKKMMASADKLEQFSSVAGMTAAEFKQAFETDALGALGMFIGGLNDTERNGQTAIAVLNDMGLTEVRLSNAILSLANNSDDLTKAVDMSNQAWEENDALTREAELRYGTTESQLDKLKHSVEAMGIEFGQMLLPIIQQVVEALRGAVDWIRNLDDGTKQMILTVAAIVAGIAPLLIGIGKVISTVGSVIGILPKLSSGLSSVFSLISAHPVIIVITAIIAILVTLWNKCEWFREGVMTIINTLTNIFKSFIDFIKAVFVAGWTVAIEVISGVFTSWFNSVKSIFENIKGIFGGIIDFIKNIFTGNWKGAWEAVVSVFGNVFGLIGNIVKAPINMVIGIINAALEGINKLVIDIPDWVPLVGGKRLGFNIPTIPMLAKGGELLAGMAIVAEAGPELISQQGGRTVVTPLSSGSKNSAKLALDDETISKLAAVFLRVMRELNITMQVDERDFGRLVHEAL